jgi:hypothetical protein
MNPAEVPEWGGASVDGVATGSATGKAGGEIHALCFLTDAGPRLARSVVCGRTG